MTLDDLRSAYNRGFWSVPEAAGLQAQQNAGIAAVIRALRDDMRYMMINRDSIDDMFDKILGDAGNEKVAGSTPEGAVQTRSAKGEPPASPATDICEWEKLRNSFGFEVSCSTKWLMNENYGGDMCPLCDKRIEYKFEPATDPAPANRKHPSHETRISFDASSYDEICVRCGATDRIGSWGRLAEPCSKPAPVYPDEPLVVSPTGLGLSPAPAPAVCVWTPQRSLPDWRLTSCGMVCTEQSNRNGKCQSCGKTIKFTEAQR